MSEEIVPHVFENSEFGQLRVTQDENGEPWFVAKDVCDALGLDTSHVRRGLDDDEVTTLPNWQGKGAAPLIVSEAGLYSLILKSRKPEAKRFRRWVTHDVLPAIRRDGGYMVAREDETPQETMARALLIAQRAIEGRDARIASQERAIESMKPKAAFFDAVADADGRMSVADFSKVLAQAGIHMGQNRLFKWFRNHGYMGKGGVHRNRPTQRCIERGWFVLSDSSWVDEHGTVNLKFTPMLTPKGATYFFRRISGQRQMRLLA